MPPALRRCQLTETPPVPVPLTLFAATFLNSVKAQTRHAMHTDEAAAAALPRVMALARAFSMPSLFVTFSLDYSCLRPLLMVTLGRIAGGKIDGTYQMRTHALAHAPGEAAKAYLAAFDAFLEYVQLWSGHACCCALGTHLVIIVARTYTATDS